MLNRKIIDEYREYMESGRWEEDFGYRTPDGQGEMLDMIEALFQLCDAADQVISRKFYEKLGGMPHGQ